MAFAYACPQKRESHEAILFINTLWGLLKLGFRQNLSPGHFFSLGRDSTVHVSTVSTLLSSFRLVTVQRIDQPMHGGEVSSSGLGSTTIDDSSNYRPSLLTLNSFSLGAPLSFSAVTTGRV